jgi:hypothetical protein
MGLPPVRNDGRLVQCPTDSLYAVEEGRGLHLPNPLLKPFPSAPLVHSHPIFLSAIADSTPARLPLCYAPHIQPLCIRRRRARVHAHASPPPNGACGAAQALHVGGGVAGAVLSRERTAAAAATHGQADQLPSRFSGQEDSEGGAETEVRAISMDSMQCTCTLLRTISFENATAARCSAIHPLPARSHSLHGERQPCRVRRSLNLIAGREAAAKGERQSQQQQVAGMARKRLDTDMLSPPLPRKASRTMAEENDVANIISRLKISEENGGCEA